MKTTITLILMMFYLVGRGQDIDSVEVELPIIGFPVSGNYHQPTPIEQLLSHWKTYKQECWNDSTLSHTHEAKWNDRCYTQRGNLASGYWMEETCLNRSHFTYIHKQPTLEGFMDYLDGKK